MILARGENKYLEKTMNKDSILTSTKKLLNIDENDTSFDVDVTIHINSALATLTQLGVGPKEGFRISDKKSKWTDFVGENQTLIGFISDFVFLKVKLIFDPPTSSFVVESMKQNLSELEWRINSAIDY